MVVLCLSGCMAGISKYTVEPFYDADAKAMVCCRASVTSGKNIGTVTAHIIKDGNNFTVDLQESAIDSSSSIKAAAAPVSDISNAVSNTAITVGKLEGKLP